MDLNLFFPKNHFTMMLRFIRVLCDLAVAKDRLFNMYFLKLSLIKKILACMNDKNSISL